MTNEEAMDILGSYDVNFFYSSGEHEGEKIPLLTMAEACDIGREAILKQMPKKPYRKTITYPYMPDMDVCQCPSCLRRLRTTRTTANGDAYCPKCGQHIDWSE